jgi:hypothetical protein
LPNVCQHLQISDQWRERLKASTACPDLLAVSIERVGNTATYAPRPGSIQVNQVKRQETTRQQAHAARATA